MYDIKLQRLVIDLLVQRGPIFYILLDSRPGGLILHLILQKLWIFELSPRLEGRSSLLAKQESLRQRSEIFQLLKAVRCQTGHWDSLAAARKQEDR